MKIVSTLAFLSLIALGGTLVVTNPSEEDYAQYLSESVTTETQVALCQPEGFSEWLGKVGEALSGACQGLIGGGQSLSEAEIEETILANTDYKNYGVFSTYITRSPLGNYRTIGVFDRFVTRETNNGEASKPVDLSL